MLPATTSASYSQECSTGKCGSNDDSPLVRQSSETPFPMICSFGGIYQPSQHGGADRVGLRSTSEPHERGALLCHTTPAAPSGTQTTHGGTQPRYEMCSGVQCCASQKGCHFTTIACTAHQGSVNRQNSGLAGAFAAFEAALVCCATVHAAHACCSPGRTLRAWEAGVLGTMPKADGFDHCALVHHTQVRPVPAPVAP